MITQNRRTFLRNTAMASAAVMASSHIKAKAKSADLPLVISTWEHGLAANEVAWKILTSGGRALDAVEQGVRVSEADPNVSSVGYGGLPDRDGNVTLDACIMDEHGNCGSVAFLKEIMHPISVARLVMEKTPHIMLAGKGAQEFALANGFKKQNLLTENSKAAWEEWRKKSGYQKEDDKRKKDRTGKDNHDTIGMLAIDRSGNISGACTTSGLAWKYHGRVGDSPIIGAGLFVDNEVGAACATGKGEAVIKIAGSAIIVEMMRNGLTPQQACKAAVERIIKKQNDYKTFQVGFLAVNKNGEFGAFSINKGFQFALFLNNSNSLMDASSS